MRTRDEVLAAIDDQIDALTSALDAATRLGAGGAAFVVQESLTEVEKARRWAAGDENACRVLAGTHLDRIKSRTEKIRQGIEGTKA